MPRFSTICIWSICISIGWLAGLSCNRSERYQAGPEGMRWRLVSFSDPATPLDSVDLLYIDAAIITPAGDTVETYHNRGFRPVEDSLWSWLTTRNVGDSLELVRSSPDFLAPPRSTADTLIYHLKILGGRTRKELSEARTAEMLALDSLIRTDSIREFYRELHGVYFRRLVAGDTTRRVEEGREIVIHYRGSTLDGTVFDDSRRMARPLRFVYGDEDQVLEGLDIVLDTMSRGEVVRAVLPSRLAYGSRGSANGSVRPYRTVVYTVEVVEVGL